MLSVLHSEPESKGSGECSYAYRQDDNEYTWLGSGLDS